MSLSCIWYLLHSLQFGTRFRTMRTAYRGMFLSICLTLWLPLCKPVYIWFCSLLISTPFSYSHRYRWFRSIVILPSCIHSWSTFTQFLLFYSLWTAQSWSFLISWFRSGTSLWSSCILLCNCYLFSFFNFCSILSQHSCYVPIRFWSLLPMSLSWLTGFVQTPLQLSDSRTYVVMCSYNLAKFHRYLI